MRAMVLGAGLGTRLRPLTLERPKPAVPLGLRPMAMESIDALGAVGIDEFVMNLHHLADRMPRLLEEHLEPGTTPRFVVEERLLGTGGGLRGAGRWLEDGELIVVVNGDIDFRSDLRRAIALHRRHNAHATMVLREDPAAERYGSIELGPEGRVWRMLGCVEVPGPRPVDLRTLMFTGVHILSPAALRSLPEQGCVVRDGYFHWLRAGQEIRAIVDGRPWRDLGTMQAYWEANMERAEGNLVHPSAEVSALAELEQCVVGAGAVVGPGRYEQSVLWPGAKLSGGASRCIVTPENRVKLS